MDHAETRAFKTYACVPRARSSDLRTAHEAAERMRSASSPLCALVLMCLRENGPLTTHEIAEKTGLAVVTVSPRIKPLRDAGLVAANGYRREKRSVWVAV